MSNSVSVKIDLADIVSRHNTCTWESGLRFNHEGGLQAHEDRGQLIVALNKACAERDAALTLRKPRAVDRSQLIEKIRAAAIAYQMLGTSEKTMGSASFIADSVLALLSAPEVETRNASHSDVIDPGPSIEPSPAMEAAREWVKNNGSRISELGQIKTLTDLLTARDAATIERCAKVAKIEGDKYRGMGTNMAAMAALEASENIVLTINALEP